MLKRRVIQIIAVLIGLIPACAISSQGLSRESLRLSSMVNDLPSALRSDYTKDLEKRLRRFNEKSGYAIVIVMIPSGEDEQISELISQFFATNRLEQWSSAGTALVLMTVQEGWVIVEPSPKIEKKFLTTWAAERIDGISEQESKNREIALERRLQALIEILNPWFYELDPPSAPADFAFYRSPTAEIILFPLAPFIGLMVGAALMAFTSAGQLQANGRFLVGGFVGGLVTVLIVFLVRQRGGIVPGMLYYSASISFVVAALVGALRPFWFRETIRGRKPGEKMHPPFYGRG
ncbi:MAG: TPM domain-containing protein [Deltaproteobacteria bacterium]|nr:TPM domain-containing protein [Deltaproteobacteria bacterium]